MNWITPLFLSALFINLLIEVWLNIKNQFHIGKNREQVPEDFTEIVSLEAHQKAADYSRAKLQLGRLGLFYDAAIIWFMTLGGGFQSIYSIWLQSGLETQWLEVAFLLSTLWVLSILHLPFAILSTFKIEAEFGFNKTTPMKFITDLLKQWLLILALGLPLIWVVLSIMTNYIEQAWWFYTWVVWMSFQLIIMWAYPKWIAPIFNKFTPLEDEEMKTRITQLLERTGFESNGIFVMDGSSRSGHGNAYFTGMGKNKRIVFFDTLLETLTAEEVEAVLAHELGHFKHGHIRKRLIEGTVYSLIGLALLGWLIQLPEFYAGLGMQDQSPAIALLLFMTAVPVMFFFMGPIGAMKSRKHEFEADSFAAEHVGAEHLISALLKMYRDNASTLTPDPLYSAYHDSHPPAKIRIDHLKSLLSKQDNSQ
ncbi:M48 family metallopeptidase [Thiomicrorhabdus lithotrophica]|uniref:M48 family metallopeptidase n=1 Tax=Thiomicrorhabdus lithotrophica TaxID=2949997 RepID=A0ABY8C9R6_9GAMM|nr:M48 family metallopeptidase [Thiomicrorhabdus lithotrophica]WEJ61982.1 M48 family metallopeptidase [Thiomicrorhabdus lithotrophica]